jgi:hypothetical protein
VGFGGRRGSLLSHEGNGLMPTEATIALITLVLLVMFFLLHQEKRLVRIETLLGILVKRHKLDAEEE